MSQAEFVAVLDQWALALVGSVVTCSGSHPDARALGASEEWLRLLVQGTREYGIFMLDPDGLIATWNAGAHRLKGYSEAEAVGRHFSMFYTQEQRDNGHPQSALTMARAQGSFEEEAWRVRKDGSQFWASVVITALRDADGRLRGFGKVTKDLTDRRLAQQALQASEEMFRRVFVDAPIGVSLVGINGRFLQANPALASLTGYSVPTLLTMSFRELTHPDDIDADVAALGGLVRGELPSFSRDKRYLTAAGGSVWVNVHVVPVRDAEGQVTALLAHTQDISGRLRYEGELRDANAELRRARERAEVLWRAAPIGVSEATPAGVLTSVNEAFASMLGHTPEQMVGMRIAELVDPDVSADVAARLVTLRHGEGYTVDRRFRTADGGSVPVYVATTVLRDDSGEVDRLAAFTVDMTAAQAEREARVDAIEQLTAERSQLAEAQRLGQLGSFTFDVGTGALTFSEEIYRIWGLPPGADLATLRRRMIHPKDLDRVTASWKAAMLAGGQHEIEYRISRPDGDIRHLRVILEVAVDATGTAVEMHGTHLDVTALTTAQREAQAARGFLSAVLVAAPDYTFVTNFHTGVLVFGPEDREVLGVSTAELKARGPACTSGMTHPDDLPALKAAIAEVAELEDGHFVQVRTRGLHADGSWRYLSRRLTPFRRDRTGAVVEMLGTLRDVTDLVEAEDKLTQAALHDPLTALPNRARLMDRLAEALNRVKQSGQEMSVLFCDLDGFKRVNDTAGHGAGDAVLVETAARLKAALRQHDTVARVGGDEFVMIVVPWDRIEDGSKVKASPTDSRTLAQELATRVAESMKRPIVVDGSEHVISVSIGIAHAGPGVKSADEVLQNADAAMYRAKHAGKDRFEVYEQGHRTGLIERGRVEHLLRRALIIPPAPPCRSPGAPAPPRPGPSLTAAYQPIVQEATGALLGFEALARLTDAEGLPVTPEVFIGVAEGTGLIRPLGLRMLTTACAQLALWRTQHPAMGHVTMAVNVSALQAQHVSLSADVWEALTAAGLHGQDLVLELTETALLEAANSTLAALRDLRTAGVGIAIDDFGIGYASLRYLATLPVTAVKVDRSFTAGVVHDPTSRKILHAVAGLAADLELDCVVEGVETQQQRDALPTGVQIQGWLTGRPFTAEQASLPSLLCGPASRPGRR